MRYKTLYILSVIDLSHLDKSVIIRLVLLLLFNKLLYLRFVLYIILI